MHSRLHNKTI
jgi:DNA-binding beta-propeller fold protein YncE